MIDEKVLRLELAPAPLDLIATGEQPADADGEPEPDQPRRQLAGLAVPYEIEAKVGLQLVTFAAGSVTPASRSPLLFGHDPNRPIGILAATQDSPQGLRGSWSVDQTGDGDTALIQAASGSRSGLSVGVDVDEFEQDPDTPERIRVTAATLAETSLVAMAAYLGASVDQIAAEKPRGKEPAVTDQPTPTDAGDQLEPAPPPRPALILADRDQPEMRLGDYLKTLIQAEKGDRGARERITAALTRGDITTSPGVVPVTYVQQVIDSLGADRPLFDAMDHADMPASGMTIRRPEVTDRPNGGWLANDQAGAPSDTVAIVNHDETVKQWAWGGSASVALVERSAPSYIEEIFAQVVKNYYRAVEADIASAFPSAVGGAGSVGTAVATFMEAYRTSPDLLVLGALAYGRLLDATGVAMFISGSADAAGNASYAGMNVVTSADLPPGDGWVTRGEFQEVRESAPIRLSVSDVTSLSLEIGVTSFYARTQTLQPLGAGPVNGAVGIPTFTPLAAAAQASGRGSK
jgi:HK97 family phage prohead protease